MIDTEIKLENIDEIDVFEDEYGNLILTFKKDFTYSKGSSLKIWSSEIASASRKAVIKKAIYEIERTNDCYPLDTEDEGHVSVVSKQTVIKLLKSTI